MKNKISLPLPLVALLATVTAAFSQTTTLTISNNSFESPGYGGQYTAVSSNSYFPGWSIVNSNANIYGTFVINTAAQGFTGTAGTGTNAVQFYTLPQTGQDSGSAYVYQTLNYNFIAGDTYTLSAAAQATAPSEIFLSTNSGTTGIVGSTNFQTSAANTLTTFTFNFTATLADAGQAITVGFYVPNFAAAGQGGDAVDNFVLTQTFNAPITTYQWTNTPADSNFSTAANWVGGNAPTNNTALVFGPSTIGSLNNDFVNATNASLTFTSNAPAYTIGGNTLTLTYGVTNSSTNTLVLNLPIAGTGGLALLGQDTTILNATNSYAGPTTVGSNNTLILAGGITTNGGISINGSKFVEYTNATIAGPGGITTTGSNAIVRLNGTNTYTGATTIGGGSLTLNGSVSNTAITVSSGSTLTESASGVVAGSQGITVSGSNTVVNLAGNNSFTGALNIGSGSVTLSGNNTNRPGNAGYTTSLSGGVLQLQANPGNTVGGTSYALSAESTANSLAFTGGTLQLLSDSSVTFAGGNGMAIVNAGTTLNFDVDSVTPGNSGQTITFAPTGIATIANTTFNVTGSTNGYTLVLPGISAVSGFGMNLSANGADVQFGGLFNASFLNVSGVNNTTVTGSISSGTVAKSGDGTLTLSGTNSYTGSTTVSAGTLLVNGPISASAISVTGGNLAEENNGVISGTSSLQVTNTGIATLTGPNTYSGGTVVGNGGEIDLLGGGTIGTGFLRLTGGTIDLGGETISNALTMTSGTLQDGTVTNSSRFVLGGGTVDAMLQGTNGLTVNGVSNTLILVGPQQITGGVTVSNTATLQGDTTALNGDILNNGNVTFAQSGDGTYTGASNGITGTGSVTINGTANLTLQGDTNGNNSYSGGTVVQSGGLILTQPGSIGSGTLSVQGGTVNLGGATITNGFTASGGTVGNGTLSNNNGYTLQGGEIDALLAGSGTLTSAGPGTVILTAANTYSGGTVASGGTLDLTNAGTIGTGALTVSGGTVDLGGGTLTNTIASLTSGTIQNGSITNSGNYIFQGGSIINAPLQGPGSLTMNGVSNTLILKGAQAYTGGTTVSAGTLQVDTTSLNGDVTDNANLTYAQTTNGTYQGTLNGITGIGSLTINGSATLTLGGDINNNNSYSGGTIVKSGGLLLDAAGSIGSGTLSVAGGTVNLNNLTITNAFTSSGGIVTNGVITNNLGYTLQGGTIYANLEGAGTLTMNGSNNTLILAAVNTYSGGTVASAGTIALTNGGTIGSGSLTITGGTVDLGGETLTNAFSLAPQGTIQNGSITNSGNYIFQGGTIAATLQGPGSLTMNGVSNTLILEGHQAYTGGTFITAGTLQGDSVSLGGGDITDNGNLTFAQTNNGTYSGSANGISGTGSVTINGTGTLTLGGDGSGNNSYTGGTLVTNGGVILSSAGSIGTGTLTVAGGSIDLNGKVITNALVSSGGSISDGTLTNDAGYTLQGGTVSAVIAGAGTLTMNGSNNTLTLEGVNTYSGGTVASAGTLGITNGGTLGTGSVLINGAIFDLGAGTYTANNTTITSGTIRNGVLTNSGTYTNLQGGTILATIQGTNGLAFNTSSNNLILGASNSYSGGTTVGAGTLTLETNTALGAGSLTISGGTVDLGGTTLNDTLLTVSPNGTIQNGFITNSTAYNLQYGTYNASLQGTNGLIKNGAGTLTLGGNNSYSGGTILNSGTVTANNGGAFGSGTVTFASNSTVLNGTTNIVTLNNSFVIASNTVGTFDSGSAPGATNNPNELVIAGVISGAGTLSLQSETNSQVTLNPGSSNTYTGGTLLNGGQVQFGISGINDFGSGAITFVTNTTMRALSTVTITNAVIIDAGAVASLSNPSATYNFTYSGSISGAGVINSTAINGATNYLSGSNTYSGGTIASSGTIQGLTNTSFGTGTITLAGGTVDLNGQTFTNVLAATSGTIQNGKITNNLGYTLQGGTINAILQGTNGLTKVGSSTLTLGATNTYTGPTTISGGTLAATPATLGKGVVLDNANLSFTQSGAGTYTSTSTNGISGTGSVTMAGSGTLFLNGFGGSGVNTYSGGTIATAGLLIPKSTTSVGSGTLTIAGGTLDLNQYTYTNTLSATGGTVQDGTITNSSQFVLQGGTINAILQGTNGLLMNGASNTLTLQGEQDYTGGTTISAGTLVGDSTSIQGDVVNNSTLTFTQNTNGTYTGSSTGISGTGLVTLNGSATLTLGGDANGNNSYSGGTIVGGTGGVILSNSESLGSGELTVVGGTVDLGGNTITNTYNFTQGTVEDGTISPTDGGNNTIGGTTTIGATIAGNDGVNVSAGANVTFTTVQTYTGPTVLGTNATVNNSGSSFSSSSLTLSHGSTYNFSGSATVPSLPAINGTINPGGSFNTVTINALGSATNTTTGLLSITNGNLTLGGTTTMLLNNSSYGHPGTPGINYDSVNGTAALNYGGTLDIRINNPSPGTYNLFSGFSSYNTNSDFTAVNLFGSWNPGAFTETGSGVWTYTPVADTNWVLTFSDASGQLVVAVPEPSTWALLGVSLIAGLVIRRKLNRREENAS